MRAINNFKSMRDHYLKLSTLVKEQQKKDLRSQNEMSKEFHNKKSQMKKYFEN